MSSVPGTYTTYSAQPVELLVCTLLTASTPDIVRMQSDLLRQQNQGGQHQDVFQWHLEFILSLLWVRCDASSGSAPDMDGGSEPDPADDLSPGSSFDHHECGVRMARLRRLGVPTPLAEAADKCATLD